MRTGEPYLLLYDGDCRICSAFAHGLRFVDVHRKVRVQTIQSAGALLAGLPPDGLLDAAHAVSPDGRVTTGPDAMPMLAGALLANSGVEARLRSSDPAMRFLSSVYRILVDLRGRLTCRVPAPSSAARTPR